MKRLIFILALLTGFCLHGTAESTPKDTSATDATVVSQLVDEEAAEEEMSVKLFSGNQHSVEIDENWVAVIAIIMGCGLPLFIVIAILWFKYKNKQAKYRLASQAIASGKEIPQELFEADYSSPSQNNDILSKGIKNVCLGIGLTVFLWMLTEVKGVAAVGFLIFCMGVGQILIAYATRERKPNSSSPDKPFIQMHQDKEGTRHIKVGGIEFKKETTEGKK